MESAAARAVDPETSHEAAASLGDVTELQSRVLESIRGSGETGLTAFELAERLGLQLNTVSPRTAPLVRKGLVVDSGKRRRGPSGRKSTVWIAFSTLKTSGG